MQTKVLGTFAGLVNMIIFLFLMTFLAALIVGSLPPILGTRLIVPSFSCRLSKCFKGYPILIPTTLDS